SAWLHRPLFRHTFRRFRPAASRRLRKTQLPQIRRIAIPVRHTAGVKIGRGQSRLCPSRKDWPALALRTDAAWKKTCREWCIRLREEKIRFRLSANNPADNHLDRSQ